MLIVCTLNAINHKTCIRSYTAKRLYFGKNINRILGECQLPRKGRKFAHTQILQAKLLVGKCNVYN